MKKRSKKFLTAGISTLVATSLVAASFFVAFRTKPIIPVDTYLMHFNENDPATAEANKSKNAYIAKLKEQTKNILDWYEDYYQKEYGEPFPGLNFRFTNLNSAPSEGEKNYFSVLNRTFKEIDPRLGIINIPRTPVAVNEGYYNKNTDMINLYWSADFDSISTWFTYVFSEDFAFANQWPRLYEKLLHNKVAADQPWVDSLKAFIESKDLFINPIDAINQSIHSKTARVAGEYIPLTSFYANLANVIGSWTEQHSTNLDVTQHNTGVNDVYGNPIIVDTASNPGMGINFMQWLTSSVNNLPFVDDGPNTNVPYLIRNGYYNVKNPVSDTNFRDWFVNKSVTGDNTVFRWWTKPNPFDVNKTPFNPSFSNSPSSSFFTPAWTGLTSWTTTSSYEKLRDPSNPINPNEWYLVATGATALPPDTGYNLPQPKITFKVRPIPWVDKNGNQLKDENGKPAYLSPADFSASLVAFVRSIQLGINSNDYFFDLINLDVGKTVQPKDPSNPSADNPNWARNTSPTDTKEFTIYLKKKPEVSYHSFLDILQKQYFNAIPAFNQKVKNIIDYNTFKKLINGVEGTKENHFIPYEHDFKEKNENVDFRQFYGCGNPALYPELLNDYAFAGPYYISFIDDQRINFNLNKLYFSAFDKEVKNTSNDPYYKVPVKDMYQSFNIEQNVPATPENKNKEDNVIGRIDQVQMKYAGSYSESLTYEQFKANELDLSEVNSAKLLSSSENFPNDFRSLGTKRASKSNLVSFNLQVYAKDSNDKSVILDTNGNPIYKKDASGNDVIVGGRREVGYWLDDYGNYVFPEGVKPKIKSKITKSYYDLIVRDFYTPIEAYDTSKNVYAASSTIRETLVNSINWESLKTLVFPGITKSVQYSFLPYGVYPIGPDSDPKTFFWYASSKPYMTDLLDKALVPEIIGKRKCGMVIWTYNEMRSNSIQKGDK